MLWPKIRIRIPALKFAFEQRIVVGLKPFCEFLLVLDLDQVDGVFLVHLA
jgi:hypothetical protein